MTQLERITKPAEVITAQDNLDLFVLYVLGASLPVIKPDQKLIPCKYHRKETPSLLTLIKEPIPETINPSKRSQGYSIIPP